MRSDLLAEIGKWRDSDVMDGSDFPEPSASLKRLLSKAQQQNFDVDVFGRFYSEGNGIHDTHLNQGLIKGFIHRDGDDSNDHNDIWQDGPSWLTSARKNGRHTSLRSTSSLFRPTNSTTRCPERRRVRVQGHV
jgi:hypothetical protein